MTTKQFAKARTRRAEIPRELQKGVLAEYRVEPGDVLYMEPADIESPVRLPGDQTVQLDGFVSLGEYGRANVAGKTIDEIQSEVQSIVDTLEKGKDVGQIIVRAVNWESKVYYVLGEVENAGSFRVTGRETVLDAIIAAGGLKNSANVRKIILSRPTNADDCRTVLPVCYNHIVQLGDSSTNYQLQPGDRIYIPSLGFFDDLVHTLFPRRRENCPKCSSCQNMCPPGNEQSQLVPTGLQPITTLPATPKSDVAPQDTDPSSTANDGLSNNLDLPQEYSFADPPIIQSVENGKRLVPDAGTTFKSDASSRSFQVQPRQPTQSPLKSLSPLRPEPKVEPKKKDILDDDVDPFADTLAKFEPPVSSPKSVIINDISGPAESVIQQSFVEKPVESSPIIKPTGEPQTLVPQPAQRPAQQKNSERVSAFPAEAGTYIRNKFIK
jgi:protein involved in polysaccharide export with SLBB domain